ncbi:MAG: long-chain fatty acid--CoA ligase [Burkholderiaceae bacterium]|nr:MAG: long-chain fatty acid--CoA ligase [Burkholderiaceae bacterium]
MYSNIKNPEHWILSEIVDEIAEVKADVLWLSDDQGNRLSFGEAKTYGRRAAGYFHKLNIKPGDRVGVFMYNSCDFALVWLGLGYLGATAVFLNTELRANFLKHQLLDSGVAHVVADAELLGSLAELADECTQLKTVVVSGDIPSETTFPDDWAVFQWPQLAAEPEWTGPAPRAWDIAAIMYTSGTSGPAKGVLMPYAHCALYGIGTIECLELTEEDRYYISLPMFHANALLMQLFATLLVGCAAFTRRRFSAGHWLADIRKEKCTVTNLLGATAAFVLAQPATDADRDHSLRALMNAPNVPVHESAFHTRFGIKEVLSGYGMTENNIPIWGKLGHSVPGAAGWVHQDHFEVRIADTTSDMPVRSGEIGEILVRPKVPNGFMAGYLNAPDKTVAAWRNLWFHTGDAGTMDDTGLVTFVDRLRDCIRRRGHNISASEIEDALSGIEGVAEVAAFPVPSDILGGEDEIMLAVVGTPGSDLDPVKLGREACERVPRFARPRFIKIVGKLPKTATGKVQRAVLREQGRADATDLS